MIIDAIQYFDIVHVCFFVCFFVFMGGFVLALYKVTNTQLHLLVQISLYFGEKTIKSGPLIMQCYITILCAHIT